MEKEFEALDDNAKHLLAYVFRTRCRINTRSCSMIIDRRDPYNFASTALVEKLGLPLTTLDRPYFF